MKFLKDERLLGVLMGPVHRNNEQLFSIFMIIKNQDAKQNYTVKILKTRKGIVHHVVGAHERLIEPRVAIR